MVLADLGGRLQSAMTKLMTSSSVDESVINEMVKEIQRALLDADVNVRLVAQLSKSIKEQVDPERMALGIDKRIVVKRIVFEALCKLLDPGKKPYEVKKGRPNVIMFVGLQGSGKTTSCTKLAYYYHHKRRLKTCLICADTFRAGAYDQLRMNAAKANIPYYGSYTERDPVRVAQDGVELFKEEGFDVIIVDTSGRHSQEAALFEEMEQISLAVNPDEIIFVLDGSIGQAAFDQAQAFGKTVDIGSVIITKLDQQNSKGGGALSAVAATSSPITHIGTGEHITDFEKFEPQRFVTKLLGGGDIGGLMEAMSNIDMKEQKEAVDSIMAGKFSLRIMRDQFQNLLSLGPLDQVMGMIPGLSQMLPKGSEELSSARIKRTMTIMDSMTEEELDAPDLKIFSDSRIRRIAQGAGVHPAHIQELFQMYKPFKDALSKLPKMRGGRGGGPGNMRQLNEMMSALNPQAAAMMKQMGGPNMLQNMMKQMQQMGMGGKGGKGGFPMGFDPKMFGM